MNIVQKTLTAKTNSDGIIDTMSNVSDGYFNNFRKDGNSAVFEINTAVLNPVVDLVVGVSTKDSSEGTNVQFKTQAKINTWFWATIALVTGLGIVLDVAAGDATAANFIPMLLGNAFLGGVISGILYWFQKRKALKNFDLLLEELEFQTSDAPVAETA